MKMGKDKFRRLILCESGGASAENIMALALLLIPLLLLIIAYKDQIWKIISEKPDFLNNGILVAVIGAVFGSFAWILKGIYTSMQKNATLLIIELLSKNERMHRREIRKSIQREHFEFYIFQSIIPSAIEHLFSSGKVEVREGFYELSRSNTKNI